MKFAILALGLIILSTLCYADIIINEVMYNPYGSDNNKEFVEIKGVNNLSGYIVGDLSSNDTLTELVYNEYSNFSLIVEEEFNYSNLNCSVYSAGLTIGNDLNNDGDTVFLYFNDTLIDFASYNSSKAYGNNKSLELVNNVWVESLEDFGSPGRENTGLIVNDSDTNETNSTIDGKLDININISTANLSLNYTLQIYSNIETTFSLSKEANLIIKIARNINGTWKYKWYIIEDEQLTISNKTFLNYSWSPPEDLIRGDYKVLATLYYDGTYTSSGKEFYVNGLEDLGEYNMSIVNAPLGMGFGGISKITVKFDSKNYNIKNASFVAYIYEPRWASIDLDDNTLMTRPYNTDAAVRFDNISRGTTSYVSIPILTKRNCDGDYSDGSYKGKARLYIGSDDILEQSFNFTISGRNEAMCPEGEIKYVTKSTNSQSASTKVSNPDEHEDIADLTEKFAYDKVNFEIDIPKMITDYYMEINVTAKNPTNETKVFEIRSYVLSGRKAITDTYINKKRVILESNETETFKLINSLEHNLSSGEYKAMVKINSSNRKTEKSVSKSLIASFDDAKNSKEPLKISSFYTKARKFQEEITITSGCGGEKNQSGYTLNIYSFDGEEKKECESSVGFKVKIKEGDNLFFLTLEKNSIVYDIKKMIIIANKTDISVFSDSSMMYGTMNTYNQLAGIAGQKNLLTGKAVGNYGVVYESSNEKVKKLIKYIVPTVFIIGIALYLRRDKLVSVHEN